MEGEAAAEGRRFGRQPLLASSVLSFRELAGAPSPPEPLPDDERGIERAQGDEPPPLGHILTSPRVHDANSVTNSATLPISLHDSSKTRRQSVIIIRQMLRLNIICSRDKSTYIYVYKTTFSGFIVHFRLKNVSSIFTLFFTIFHSFFTEENYVVIDRRFCEDFFTLLGGDIREANHRRFRPISLEVQFSTEPKEKRLPRCSRFEQRCNNVPTERNHGDERVSGARKIDNATGTLGYSVNDDKRLPSTIRSPLITIENHRVCEREILGAEEQ